MFDSVMNALFGCTHKRITFPQTPRRGHLAACMGTQRRGTYVACLECGREFRYDWNEMRIGESVPARPNATAPAESFFPANQ
jgi:hypothetical protein